jgi:hypothetical protein
MAKTSENTALSGLHGKVDKWVYKRYKRGTVVTRHPDMSEVVWSPAQIAHRDRIRRSGEYYREMLKQPEVRARLQAMADAEDLPLPAVALREFMRREKSAPRPIP